MKERIFKVILPVILVFFLFMALNRIFGYYCPIRLFTGFSCPGCGMTRAWRKILLGDIKGAFYCHPLFLVPVPVVFIIAFRDKIPSKLYNAIMAAVAGLFIIVYIIRMTQGSPVMNRDFHEGLIWKIYTAIRYFRGE